MSCRPIEHVAPARVNLLGEHADYTCGLALPMAIPFLTQAVSLQAWMNYFMVGFELLGSQQRDITPESASVTLRAAIAGAGKEEA